MQCTEPGFELTTLTSHNLSRPLFQFLLNSDDFKSCDLVRIHHFSAISILKEVQNFIANRSIEEMVVDSYPDINRGVIEDE